MTVSAKRFLAGYFALYVIVALALNVLLGPPGMSEEYLDTYKDEHDRYLSIIKDTDYKLWRQRPELHPSDDALADDIAFVYEYESRPEFVAEGRRRALYATVVDFFNVGMVIALAVRFGRKPFLRFVDSRINEVRHRLDRVEREREATKKRRLAVEEKLEGLPLERTALEQETNVRIERERERLAEITAQGLALIDRETQDRTQYEEMLAHRAVKEELVDEAIAIVLKDYQARRTTETETALLERFLAELDTQR